MADEHPEELATGVVNNELEELAKGIADKHPEELQVAEEVTGKILSSRQ